jgi:hypothetical protein
MKSFLTGLSLLFCTIGTFAQEKALAVDEQGKLIYYEIVEAGNTPKDSLISRAQAFFLANTRELKLNTVKGDTQAEASGKMLISKNTSGISRPYGEVAYQFYVEVKEGKYRFWLTDFNFVPYMRDRYGNFVPSTTIGTPLEREPGKLRAAEWSEYQKITAREAKALAERFKKALATRIDTSEAPRPKTTISTNKW